MPRTPEQEIAYNTIAALVDTFKNNLEEIKRNQNETETRIHFMIWTSLTNFVVGIKMVEN